MCKAPSILEQARQRRVSFAMDPNDQTEVDVQVKLIDTSLGSGEKKKMFWSKKEKRRIYKSAWAVVDQVNEQDRFNSFNHENGNVGNYEFDYIPILLRAFCSCHRNEEELTDEEHDALTEWMVYGEARRGLERYCIERLNTFMTKRKKRAIHTVLMMQSTVAHEFLSTDQQEMISNVYCKLSAQSQRFAELMGRFDEGAVMKAAATDKENDNSGY